MNDSDEFSQFESKLKRGFNNLRQTFDFNILVLKYKNQLYYQSKKTLLNYEENSKRKETIQKP